MKRAAFIVTLLVIAIALVVLAARFEGAPGKPAQDEVGIEVP
jgi:hypothetical protein